MFQQAKNEDYFFFRLCRAAVAKLFKTGLKIQMQDGEQLLLTIKMCVAKYILGQIYPSVKMLRACMDRYNDLIEIDGVTRVLNLDNLASSPELNEITINLGNRAALEMLISTLNNSKELLNSINGLKLSNNNISKLALFELLPRLSLQLVDFRFNNVCLRNELVFFFVFLLN